MNDVSTMMLIGFVFGTLVLILWVLLPFAMFGIKPLLKRLIEEQKKTNTLLAQLGGGKR
jgi:hypothetical protein